MKYQAFMEKKGEKAHRDAVAMGLQYKGFGYWADPNTGEAKYKTVNDQLVPVEPDVESDLYKGKDPDEMAAMSGAAPGGGMRQPGADQAPGGPPVGTGMNVGPASDLGAKAPEKKGWDAGPDGDTCVGGQPREDIPDDTFVGKTNNTRWTAGADGSNGFQPLDLGKLGESRQLIERDTDLDARRHGWPTTQGKEFVRKLKADRKIDRLADGEEVSAMGDVTRDKAAGMMARGEFNTDGNKNVVSKMMKPPKKGSGGGGIKGAKPKAAKPKAKKKPTGTATKRKVKEMEKMAELAKERRTGQVEKDKDLVARMNQELIDGGYFADADYDMDDVGEEVGSGAFGSVFLGKDGDSVVKEGEIGLQELAVLRKLRDNPMFPTLLKGEFTSPFSHQSSVANNPGGQPSLKRGPNERDYFNPDSMEEFEERFPAARGRYAMSLAKGEDLMDVIQQMYDDGDEEAMGDLLEKVFRARRDMHMQGIAHNDMHGGNVKVDEDGNVNIIDLGLAEDNPLAALFEGMGAISGHDGQFFMGAAPGGFGNVINQFTKADNDDMFQGNLALIEDRLMESLGDLDEEEMDERVADLDEFMRGGIRQRSDSWDGWREKFPMLQDDDKVQELISLLYDGLGNNPVAQRMSAAVDRLKNTRDQVVNPNKIRRLRDGETFVPGKVFDVDD